MRVSSSCFVSGESDFVIISFVFLPCFETWKTLDSW